MKCIHFTRQDHNPNHPKPSPEHPDALQTVSSQSFLHMPLPPSSSKALACPKHSFVASKSLQLRIVLLQIKASLHARAAAAAPFVSSPVCYSIHPAESSLSCDRPATPPPCLALSFQKKKPCLAFSSHSPSRM